MITADQFKRIVPRCPDEAVPFLLATMKEFKIHSSERIPSFIGQAAHESSQFTKVEENLNYSVDRLCAVWPKRFPTIGAAAPYARNPEALAERVYGGRMGNTAPGDAWHFRGSGFIQLTGRDNHTKCAAYFGIPLPEFGDWLRTYEGAARSAGWFWMDKRLNDLADLGDQVRVTMRVNGGTAGLEERIAIYTKAKDVLHVNR